jgi:hypothetical protein
MEDLCNIFCEMFLLCFFHLLFGMFFVFLMEFYLYFLPMMKKSAFSVLFGVLFVVVAFMVVPSISVASNVSLMTNVLTTVVDKAVAERGSAAEKLKVLKVYQILFSAPKLSTSHNKQIYAAVVEYITREIATLETVVEVKPATPDVGLEIANVDVQKVRDTVLNWHNAERGNVGVGAYVYDRTLEATAQTWANQLNATATTTNTHRRTVGDGYYNYDKIMEWFEGLGVEFPVLA